MNLIWSLWSVVVSSYDYIHLLLQCYTVLSKKIGLHIRGLTLHPSYNLVLEYWDWDLSKIYLTTEMTLHLRTLQSGCTVLS